MYKYTNVIFFKISVAFSHLYKDFDYPLVTNFRANKLEFVQ